MRRILSLLLAVCMCLSIGSVSVFADDTLSIEYEGEVLLPSIDEEWGGSANYFNITDSFYGDGEALFLEQVISLEADYRADWWNERGFHIIPKDVTFSLENVSDGNYYVYVDLTPYTLCPDGVYHNDPASYLTGDCNFPNFEYICDGEEGLYWGGNMPVDPLYEDFIKKVSVGEKIEIGLPDYISEGDAFVLSMNVYESATKEISPDADYPRYNSYSWLFIVDTDASNRIKNGEIIDAETYVAPTPALDIDASVKFGDVSLEDYFYESVYWAFDNGIVAGTSVDTFSPNDYCTHEQILTMLWRAYGSQKVSGNYSWIQKGTYYEDALRWFASKGLIDKYSVFEVPITRSMVVKYLYQLSGVIDYPIDSAEKFTDLDIDRALHKGNKNTSSYHTLEAISWAVDKGITAGTSDTTFGPEGDCTRAQVVTFLYRNYLSNK